MKLRGCHGCGLVQQVPEGKAACIRCGHRFLALEDLEHRIRWAKAMVLSSLVLFPPAILLPILEIEKLGHHHKSSIVSGIRELFEGGQVILAMIILIFSIAFPLAKLAILAEVLILKQIGHRERGKVFRCIEWLGRWSMLDVMLLALLVMFVKLSGLVEFHLGSAVFAFVGCVVCSMLASLLFHPHSIWE
jgi:paraquat-inducible protein A